MASLRRVPNSPYWIACFTDADGRRTNRSTKLTDRRKAQKLAHEWQKAADDARAGRLVEGQVRRVFNSILEQVGSDPVDDTSTEEFLKQWLDTKENRGTRLRYEHTIDGFLESLGDKRNKPIAAVSHKDVLKYLDARKDTGIAARTLTSDAKSLNIPFNQARRLGFTVGNPVEKALALRPLGGASQERDNFTPEQVAALIKAASPDWKTMIMLAFYTGARLGDCARMKWDNIDFQRRVITFEQTKTKNRSKTPSLVVCPLHPDLEKQLMDIAGTDDPQEYLTPDLAGMATSGKSGLSQRFKAVMKAANIDAKETEGEGVRRFSKLTFHSLRHSFNSELANEGVNQEKRMALAGHKSKNVNDIYTHHDIEQLRKAIEKLPSVG